MSIGLLLIRLTIGATLAAHGAQKLFGVFGGHGIDGTAGFVQSLGFRNPKPWVYLLGASELAGGAFVAAGFLTPFGAAAIVGAMAAASIIVHGSNGFFASENGYEFPLALGATAAGIAFTGPGRWSLDHALDWHLNGTGWGLFALLLGTTAAGTVYASRNHRRVDAETASSA